MDLAEGISQEDIKLFLVEADEQLQLLDEDFVKLEREAGNTKLLEEIFRAAHTIKGSASMLGHNRMSQVAHALESLLDRVRKGTLKVTPNVVDALLNGLDVLRILKEELLSNKESQADVPGVISQLEAIMTSDGDKPQIKEDSVETLTANGSSVTEKAGEHPEAGEQRFQVDVTFNKDSTWTAVRAFQTMAAISEVARIISASPTQAQIESGQATCELKLVVVTVSGEAELRKSVESVAEIARLEIAGHNSAQAAPPMGNTTQTHESVAQKPEPLAQKVEHSGLGQTVRVDVARIDSLMEQIGELVINRNRIGQIGRLLGEKYQDDELIRNLGDSLTQIGKVVNMIQQDVMTIRMLPIELVFNAFPRMVRDLARKTNKQVDFIIKGQETEVDRTVIEHIKDPLVHLLRNAVDHGIETPEERKAAGKPETATVILSAYHQQDNIVITIEDNGKGIDPAAVKEAAIRKGLITAEAARSLSENEAINLIFASGVSTAKKVTEVSGRGVGLDIVKKNLEPLNGTINIETKPGKGTKFILTLPLTLAIIPALLVSVKTTVFAIALSSIDEAIDLESKNIQSVRGFEATLFRGSVLPLMRLEKALNWNDQNDNSKKVNHVVVVKANEKRVGLIVDTLIGQQEIVVKSFDHFMEGEDYITGASILGDGQVTLILDVASLVRHGNSQPKNKQRVETAAQMPVLAGK